MPIGQFKENLVKIITHPNIVAHKPKLLLVTPPPLDEIRIAQLDLAAGRPAATRQSRVSASYSEVVRQVAAQHPDVTLIDLWRALMDRAVAKTPGFEPKAATGALLGDPQCGQRGHLEHLLPDGLHLSGESYRVFFDLVKPHIGSEWRGFPDEDRVAYILPDWRAAPWLED